MPKLNLMLNVAVSVFALVGVFVVAEAGAAPLSVVSLAGVAVLNAFWAGVLSMVR